MKNYLLLFGLLFACNLHAQITFKREIKLEKRITDITAHVYSIYSCLNEQNVIAWKTPIFSNDLIHSIAVSPTGGYLANSTSNKVQIWRIDNKAKLVNSIATHRKAINSICFSSQGYLASADNEGEIHISDVKQNKLLANLKGVNGAVKCVSFNSYGNKIYSGNGDSTVTIWNIAIARIEKTIKVNSPISCMCVSSDDALIILGSENGSVKIFDCNTGDLRFNLKGHTAEVNSIAINHNNFYVTSVGADNKIIFWSIKNGSLFTVLENQKEPINKAIFSYDNNERREFLFVGGEEKYLKIWDVTELPLPLDYLIKNEIQEEISKWEQKLETESLTDYQNRISYDNKILQIKKLQNFIVNKYALRKYSFSNGKISSYDERNEAYNLSYGSNLSFKLAIPKNESADFAMNFQNLKPSVFQFIFDNEDFKLSYLELKDSVNSKVYYFDESGTKSNEIYRIDEIIAPPVEVLVEVANKQDTLKEKLSSYIQQKKEEKIISGNVDLKVNTKIAVEKDSIGNPELNYHIEYSYEVIKATVQNMTDDFPLGKYKLASSNAARITVQILKETIDKELIKYIKSGMNVTIKITGSTDATPIVNTIPYTGDFGDFEDEPYFINDNLESMSLSQRLGITKNEQLAFLRTYGVRKFIMDYIEPLNKAKLHFQHYTFVAKEKGSQYRKISIEVILHGAFSEFKNNPKVMSKSSGKMEDINEFNSDVDQNIPTNAIVNDKIFAVVIGNENYSKEIVVEYASNDARIFKQYLQKTLGIPENNIHYLENATYGQILDALKWINDITKAFAGQAKILFYYAGHGMPDEQTKSAFLLPVDGNSQNTSSAIKLSDIYTKLTEYPSLSVTVFLDACFSGATRETTGAMLAQSRGIKIKPKSELLPGNLVLFSAATGDETAFPYSGKNHGMFTYYLLKKLQESNGNVSLLELSDFITTNVIQQSIVVNKKSQTPQVNTSQQVQDNWRSIMLK